MSYTLAASLATLRQRAAMLAAIRAFFATRGVLEVETPALSGAGVTDPAIESVTATARSLGSTPLYLQTSPEFAMKRLLAAGSGDIYQICRVFRDDELGRWHEPEFVLLEWYRLGFDDDRLMTEVAELIGAALGAVRGEGAAPRRAVRVRYADAFQRALGATPDSPTAVLREQLGRRDIDVPSDLGHDGVLDLAFATVVTASFDVHALTFVHDYPVSQAALARVKATTPPVAARFEVFSGGVELANGFHELRDSVEQRRRFEAERTARLRAGRHAPPVDEQLLAALAAGLPDCAGVALGFDRLVALAVGSDNVAATMSFTHGRP